MTNENYQNTEEEIQKLESRLKTLKQQSRGDKGNPYMLPVAILVAGILIAGAVIYSVGKSSLQTASVGNTAPTQPSQPSQPSGPAVNIDSVDIAGEPFIGDPNAPVMLAYWLDFQCPFCKRFEQQTLPTLIDRYIELGELKVVFKDFQFLGSDSQDAGLVSKAVWELYPDAYFEWHEAMYNTQDGENSGFGDLASILQLIRDEVPRIDADKIAAQVEQKRLEYQQEQDADKAEGSQFGISGTPGFVIGQQRIQGAQPTSVFTQIIDTELNK